MGKIKSPYCANCGQLVSSMNEYLPFCSIECRAGVTPLKCAYCEKVYVPKTETQKFCSHKCGIARHRETYKSPVSIKKLANYRIFERDNFKCIYCGKSAHEGATLHIDHIYPLSKGGKHDLYNLVTSCKDCNISKGYSLLSDEKIIELWSRGQALNEKHGINSEYEKLKAVFEKAQPTKSLN